MISQLFSLARTAGPWAFTAVAAVLIALVVARGLIQIQRERNRSRTITDAANAMRNGGMVIQRAGNESLVVAVPRPPDDVAARPDRIEGPGAPPGPQPPPVIVEGECRNAGVQA